MDTHDRIPVREYAVLARGERQYSQVIHRSLTDTVLEGLAFDVFEDQGGRVAGFLQPVDLRDVRMVE